VPLINRVKKSAVGLVPCVHGARLSENVFVSGKNAEDLLDFSVNLNPLGPPKKLLSGVFQHISNYPDNGYPAFKKAAADSLNVLPENAHWCVILVVTGTSVNSKHHVFNSTNSYNKSIDLVFSDFEIPITVALLL
jgi:histidinol-phosphate/aromatic aminotransferase/cobyric acid decarboxylase-like protein